MRTLLLCLLAIVAGSAGCIDAMEDAARGAAALAESCGTHDSQHGKEGLMPVAVFDDGSFEVPGTTSILVIYANVSATSPGMARVEVHDPHDDIAFWLEVGTGGTSAEGSKELLGPAPGRYTVWATGTPDGAYGLQAFAAGCGASDDRS